LTANHQAACAGKPAALHQMRIALTHLRTAILFFSPMVADRQCKPIRHELRWLNAHLGAVRDLDVAIERLRASRKRSPSTAYFRAWTAKRTHSHRLLARALQSAKYRRLIKTISEWIENGPWSTSKAKQAVKQRAVPLAIYGTAKLAGWQQTLLKKSRKLMRMDAEKRHRLRLLNKRLSYSIEALEDLSADKQFARQRAGLKHLRKAQRSLGELNDDAKGHSLAATLQRDGKRADLQFLSAKREKRLLQSVATAYRKLAALT
jgi:CHAD domain-containing protein